MNKEEYVDAVGNVEDNPVGNAEQQKWYQNPKIV